MGNGCTIRNRARFEEDPITSHLSQRRENSASNSRKHSFSSYAGTNPNASTRTLKPRTKAMIKRLAPDEVVEAKGAMIAQKPKTHWDLRMISLSIQKHAILMELSEDAKDLIIDSMKFYLLPPRETVFTQGDPGVNFFVVAGGSLEVLVDGRRVSILKPGESFGEMALLHDDVRSGTVRTLDRCTLWGVDRKTFRSSVEYVNQLIYKQNRKFIDSVLLFQVLTNAQKESLMAVVNVHRFLPKKAIFSEGEFGDLLYIISEGTVSVRIQGVEKRRLSKGDYFGEMALLYNAPRSATIFAVDAVTVLCIGREHLNQVLGDSLQQIIYRNSQRIVLDTSPAFQFLTAKQKDSLISHMPIHEYPAGVEVLKDDFILGKEVLLVLRGQLKTGTGELMAEKLGCLGDVELMMGKEQKLGQAVFAAEPVETSILTKVQIEAILGGDLKSVLAANDLLSILQDVTMLKGLSVELIIRLSPLLKTCTYAPAVTLLEEGKSTDSLFIVKAGHVEVIRSYEGVKLLSERDHFEDKAFLFDEWARSSYRTKGDVTCWVLSRADFEGTVGEMVLRNLKARFYLYDVSVKMSELKIVKALSRELLGFAYLAVHKNTENLYHLRPISKAKLETSDIRLMVQAEFQILRSLEHRMLVKFVKSVIDEKRIYFLSELVLGLDLYDSMRHLGLLSDGDARFYVCGLYLVLEYLHSNAILYRDLKPEKVLVDSDGYPKLVDFAQAKVIEGRTFTVVGTPHYQAPEVLLGKGYGFAADYWSLGVIMFELLSGKLPFADEETNPVVIYNAVTRDKVEYPSYLSPQAVECLNLLLDRNPAVRAGTGAAHFMRLAWVQAFEWESFKSRTLAPPYIPKVPDFSTEVDTALKNPESVEYAIQAQEPETEHLTTRGWNWDEEFD